MKSTPQGNKQLTDIFLLFAEVHYLRPVADEHMADATHHMLWCQSKQHYPLDPGQLGRMEVYCRHVDLILPVNGADVALRARLKAHGEYAVCMVCPKGIGKARHGQLAGLAELMAGQCSDVSRYDALSDALNRSGDHWAHVLRDWMGSNRTAVAA